MYSRDSCIHLCDTMVHICIHTHGKMHLILSHACVWQDSFIHVTMNRDMCEMSFTHIEYYSVIHLSMHIHFCSFIMLNPCPCICKHHIFHMTIYFLVRQRQRTYKFRVMCVIALTCRSRKRRNLWHVTFIHVYFCDACIHTCDLMVHVYIHVFGCDVSVSSFWCVIGLYYVC